MSRYIDLDDFFKQFPELDTEPYNNLSTIFTQEDIDNVLELAYISGQQHPERSKGEWVKDPSQSNEFVDWFKCSNCGLFKDYKSTSHYCPNCGAQMYES